MDGDDALQRMEERRNELVRMVREMFPGDTITLLPAEYGVHEQEAGEEANYDQWKILITRKGPDGNYRVALMPSTPLMSDFDNAYREVFEEAMEEAQRILLDPPLPEFTFQGVIFMDSAGATFEVKAESSA